MPLTRRREMFRAALVHRCVQKQAPSYLSDIFQTNAEIGHDRTRGKNNLYLHRVKTEFGRQSFQFQGAKQWNSLPSGIKAVHNRSTFKKHLWKSYTLVFLRISICVSIFIHFLLILIVCVYVYAGLPGRPAKG